MIENKKYGRLTITDVIHGASIGKQPRKFAKCSCDCGSEKIIKLSDVLNGVTISCGCFRNEMTGMRSTRHGSSKTRIYQIFHGMHSRCYNPNSPHYSHYGGRGITVCDEWSDYDSFKKWTESSGYSDELSLDRMDNNHNYCPENCKWSTQTEQMQHTSRTKNITHNGKTMCAMDWSRETDIPHSTILYRISIGHTPEFILKRN